MPPPEVRIHYHRLPQREELFVQQLVHRSADVVITYQPATPLARPLQVQGQVVLEEGSPAVWFTFPGAWHDIGRFHHADGRFTGIYTNILTPPRFHGPLSWETTDLFLDVWQGAGGPPALLDVAELAQALDAGWIDPELAAMAQAEAERVLERAARRAWPPAAVREWDLPRVLRTIAPEP